MNEIYKFQELNLTTVRKILKKFDKSFKEFQNTQSTVYLSKSLA